MPKDWSEIAVTAHLLTSEICRTIRDANLPVAADTFVARAAHQPGAGKLVQPDEARLAARIRDLTAGR